MAVFLLLAAVLPSVHAQSGAESWVCGTQHGVDPGDEGNFRIPASYTGAFRALVVFVQFPDDSLAVHGNCGPDDWPLGTRANPTMPAIGPLLLDSLSTGPFNPESLTSYFRTISRNNFTIWGDEYAYMARHPESSYIILPTQGNANAVFDYGKLSQELLQNIVDPDSLPNFDLGQYATSGRLNHLFVVLRRRTTQIVVGSDTLGVNFAGAVGTSGVACLGSPGPPCDASFQTTSSTGTYGGVQVVSQQDGSFNLFQTIDPMRDMVNLMAHEIGHHIWTGNNHIPLVSGNSLPLLPRVDRNPPVPGDQASAFALMLGGGSGSIVYKGFATAAERAAIARQIATPAQRWIECPEVVSGQTYTLRDVDQMHDCRTLPIAQGSTFPTALPIYELILSNVQRTTPFNEPRTPLTLISSDCPDCVPIETGAPPGGLMVEVVQRSSNVSGAWQRDLVPADNQLSGFQGCDLVSGVGQSLDQVFGGDLWRAGLDRQLTPWTRPSVYGYGSLAAIPAARRAQIVASNGLMAIDNIRAGSGTDVEFDYHQDYNQRQVAHVREDWWIGTEIAGLAFNEVRVQDGATLTVGAGAGVTFNGDLVVEAGGLLVIEPGAMLRFAPGKRILDHGTLTATGATLTASGPDGWGGLYVGPEPGGGPTPLPLVAPPPAATLSGVTLSGVFYLGGLEDDPYPPYGAVEVVNRRVVVTGQTTISGSVGANGILAVGASAEVIVQGLSDIFSNAGVGLYATGGARAFVLESAILRENGVGGIYLNGYATRADVYEGAQVNDNDGIGLNASGQAHAWVRAAGNAPVNTSVSQNQGGPTALAGGSIDGGQCTSTGETIRPNRFELNYLGGNYDARAESGSTVAARYAFWGSGHTALVLVVDKSSTLDVFPIAPTATSPDPNCPVVGESLGAVASLPAGAALAETDESGASAGRGDVTPAVVALASEARRTAWGGEPDAAFGILMQAAQASVTEDDREAVYEAVGALVAAADTALSVPAVVASLQATAAGAGADRPWARRALAVAYASTNRAGEADALAHALTTESTGHAVFGHTVRVRLAVEADSADLAVGRLVAFRGIVVPTDTLAVEAFASSLALVAASFPGADLSVVTGGSGARGASGKAGSASAGSSGGNGWVDGVAVYPNPTAGRGTVLVSVSAAATRATASVYDALGRRVALLYDGPLTAGRHPFAFDTVRLAPGVYVVQVRVTPEGGSAWTEVRRVTVAR